MDARMEMQAIDLAFEHAAGIVGNQTGLVRR